MNKKQKKEQEFAKLTQEAIIASLDAIERSIKRKLNPKKEEDFKEGTFIFVMSFILMMLFLIAVFA